MGKWLRLGLVGSLFAVACAKGDVIVDEEDSGAGDAGMPSPCTVMCGGKCSDPKTDSENCGKCGNACPMSATCVQGSCQCPSGQIKCGTACVDPKADNTNCGKCGVVCGQDAGAVLGGGTWGCVSGACSVICPMPKTYCDPGGCVDTKTDNDNCGMCGNACVAMTEQCMEGQCCKAGDKICNGMCTQVQSDPNNCGMCGTKCSGNTPNCANGKCTSFLVVGTLGNNTFYKVPVSGAMTDTNTKNACTNAGLKVPCTGQNNCQYNDAQCLLTQESGCTSPMLSLAQKLGCSSPSNCAGLNGVYQNMGTKWVNNSSCGVEGSTWCSQGASYQNKFALCVQ